MMGEPVATHMKCCPAHLNSCPTSTRIMKNPLPWQKKVMWKIRPQNQGAVLAQGGSWTRGGGRPWQLTFVYPPHKWGGGVTVNCPDPTQPPPPAIYRKWGGGGAGGAVKQRILSYHMTP